jgi:hypothetical protein
VAVVEEEVVGVVGVLGADHKVVAELVTNVVKKDIGQRTAKETKWQEKCE